MKKIITAIGDQNLNQKLKQESEFEIVANDIPYKEGIIEVLENKQVDFLIVSELIQGQMDLKELIEKIKVMNQNIQIIVFLEKNQPELENYLYAKGVHFIFYDNQVEVSEIIQIIKEDKQNENQQLKEQVEQLKQLVVEKENAQEKIKEFLQRKNRKLLTNNCIQKQEKPCPIICVSGTSRSRKKYFFR